MKRTRVVPAAAALLAAMVTSGLARAEYIQEPFMTVGPVAAALIAAVLLDRMLKV